MNLLISGDALQVKAKGVVQNNVLGCSPIPFQAFAVNFIYLGTIVDGTCCFAGEAVIYVALSRIE